MTLKEFIEKCLGRGIDFDKKYSFQCVDVYREFLAYLKLKQSPGVVGARDIWDTYNKADFTAVAYRKGLIPPQGAVMIWEKSASNGNFGHVAFVVFANELKAVVGEQDGNTNSTFRLRTVDYTKVVGWLVPKKDVSNSPIDPVEGTFTLAELLEDIPTEIEAALKLKDYDWYDKKKGLGQFVETVESYKEGCTKGLAIIKQMEANQAETKLELQRTKEELLIERNKSGWELIAEGISQLVNNQNGK